MPYTTSGGNNRLGGMPKFMAATSVKVIGQDETAPETVPVLINAAWLNSHKSTDQMHKWAPMLVRVENATLKGYNGRKVYAVYEDRDAGNGVDDIITIDGKNYSMRQSALASFSADTIPEGPVNVTAILTRYGDEWQFSLREAKDVTPVSNDAEPTAQ